MMTKTLEERKAEALEALDALCELADKENSTISDECGDIICGYINTFQPAPTSAEVEEAIHSHDKVYIMKNGYYFRPEAKGYTSLSFEAGIFERSFAEKYYGYGPHKIYPCVVIQAARQPQKDVSVLVEALEELSQLGHEGMKPDYTQWLTFHDRVAEVSDKALKAFGEVV